jgi:hypothetical protein
MIKLPFIIESIETIAINPQLFGMTIRFRKRGHMNMVVSYVLFHGFISHYIFSRTITSKIFGMQYAICVHIRHNYYL